MTRGPCIALSDGTPFYLLDPRPEEIQPQHIAHALSNLCRWTGHVNRFFSVAQHCVLVSRLVSDEQAMAGLMHDASEAYIGDISAPLKLAISFRDGGTGVIAEIEDRIHAAIAERFGFAFPFVSEVHGADLLSAATERRDLINDYEKTEWGMWPEPLNQHLVPWQPDRAKSEFMRVFEMLLERKAA